MSHVINDKNKNRKKKTFNDIAAEEIGKKAKEQPPVLYKEGLDGTFKKEKAVLTSDGKRADGKSTLMIDHQDYYNRGSKSTSDYVERSKIHNNLVMNKIDPRYSSESFTISSDYLLLRCLLIDIETEYNIDGINIAVSHPKMRVNTDTGEKKIDKQYPYSNVAKLVNASPSALEYLETMFGSKVSEGDFLMIRPELVEEIPVPGKDQTIDSRLMIEFVHPDGAKIKASDAIGYVLVRKFDVIAKMNNM